MVIDAISRVSVTCHSLLQRCTGDWLTRCITCFLFLISSGGTHQIVAQETSADIVNEFSETKELIGFADYLFGAGEYERAIAEYQRSLYYLSIGKHQTGRRSDQILFRVAQSYSRLRLPQLTFATLDQALLSAGTSPMRDTLHVVYLATALAFDQDSIFLDRLRQFDEPGPRTFSPYVKALHVLFLLDDFNLEPASRILELNSDITDFYGTNRHTELSNLTGSMMNRRFKSPVLGGALSALVPGLGKVYAGRWSDGVSSFITVGGNAWIAYEGFRDKGGDSLRGWLFAGLGAVFWAGNVYGSVVAVRLRNVQIHESINADVRRQIDLIVSF